MIVQSDSGETYEDVFLVIEYDDNARISYRRDGSVHSAMITEPFAVKSDL